MTLSLLCFLSACPPTSRSSLHWISNTVSKKKKAAILILIIVIMKHDSSEGSANSYDTRHSAISSQHIRNQIPHGEKPHGGKQNKSEIKYHQTAPFHCLKFRSGFITFPHDLQGGFLRNLARFPSSINFSCRVKHAKGLKYFFRIHI